MVSKFPWSKVRVLLCKLKDLNFPWNVKTFALLLGICRAPLFCLCLCLCLCLCSIASLLCSWVFFDARFKLWICTRSAYRHSVPWLPPRFFLRGSNETTFWSVADWLVTMQTSGTCLLAPNLTNFFRTRATISSHHSELFLTNDRANRLQFNKGNNCPLVYRLLYMIGAAWEKFTLFMTVALDGNALSDVCGLNLQTVSRQSKVYSVGLRITLWQKKNQQANPFYWWILSLEGTMNITDFGCNKTVGQLYLLLAIVMFVKCWMWKVCTCTWLVPSYSGD